MLRKVDTLYNVIDVYTKEWSTYKKVTLNRSGQPITDADADGVIIRKLEAGEYFKLVVPTGSLISVRRWGAVGDGVADDTSIIQTALNLCAAYRYGISFDGIFRITSGITIPVGLPKIEFPAPMYGNSGTSTYGIKPDTSLSTGWTAVTTAATLTSFECLNLTIHGNSNTANPTVVNGLEILGGGGICNFTNTRVFNLYGFGMKINKLYDSVLINTSIERCGINTDAGGVYAFQVLESGDTTNHTVFDRLQVELSRGKAMLVESNNLCLSFVNIHSERTAVVLDGSYSHRLQGGSCTYFDARIEDTSPYTLLGGAGTSYDAFKCPNGTVEVNNGQDGFTCNIKNLDALNVRCTNGGNPNITFTSLRCSNQFRVDYQKYVLVNGQSVIKDVFVDGQDAEVTFHNVTFTGTFSSSGNNTVSFQDCKLNGNFPPNKYVNLTRGTVLNAFTPATNSIVKATRTVFANNIALNTNESRVYGFAIEVTGNLTWNGAARGYGLLDGNCRVAGTISSKWYGTPIDSYWVVGEIRYNPKPSAGSIVAYLNIREGYGSSAAWSASTFFSTAQLVNNANKVYQCVAGGTSGSTAPTHTSGTQSDGNLDWTYIGVQDHWIVYLTLAGGGIKEYWALLDQVGNLKPTGTPLRNDYTSPVAFARGDTGLYSIACDEFVAGKTVAEIQSFNTEGELGYATIEGNGLHDYVTIATYQLSDLLASNYVKGDGVLGNTLIKIYTLP